MLRAVLAAALFASMVSLNLTPAYAETECSRGTCGGAHLAPLPVAGIPALLTLAAVVGVVVIRRRKVRS